MIILRFKRIIIQQSVDISPRRTYIVQLQRIPVVNHQPKILHILNVKAANELQISRNISHILIGLVSSKFNAFDVSWEKHLL